LKGVVLFDDQPPIAVETSPSQEIERFLNYFHHDPPVEGLWFHVVHAPTRHEPTPDKPLQVVRTGWERHFFPVTPAGFREAGELLGPLVNTNEIYFAPALFNAQSNQEQFVVGSKFLWCDMDGAAMPNWQSINLPVPSLIVESSPGRYHVYWRLKTTCTDIDKLKYFNRGIGVLIGADDSGWDAPQLLRIAPSKNHKTSADVDVNVIHSIDAAYTLSDFPQQLPQGQQRAQVNVEELYKDLPHLYDVLADLHFSSPQKRKNALGLCFVGPGQQADRSTSLVHLAHMVAEAGATNQHLIVLLREADKRWGKFHTRSDGDSRLIEIVQMVRGKHPEKLTVEELPPPAFKEFSLSELSVQEQGTFYIRGLLPTAGMLMITAEPGTGKTTMALDMVINLIIGTPWMNRTSDFPTCKVLYVSFEMFRKEMNMLFTPRLNAVNPEHISLLEENLKFMDPESFQNIVSTNTEDLNERGDFHFTSGVIPFRRWAEKENINIIVLDPLEQIVDVLDNKQVKETLGRDFLRYLCKGQIPREEGEEPNNNEISLIICHHSRKNPASPKGDIPPMTLDSPAGDRQITAPFVTVIGLQKIPQQSSMLTMSILKSRHEPQESPATIYRNQYLQYASVPNFPKSDGMGNSPGFIKRGD